MKPRRRTSVTLQLLWLEYKELHADGLQYSQFCELYRRWRGGLDRVLRQEHRAGEKVFVGCESQELPEWIGAHVRMFEYFGGVPELAVPDNVKTAVQHACYYEPDLNPTYHAHRGP